MNHTIVTPSTVEIKPISDDQLAALRYQPPAVAQPLDAAGVAATLNVVLGLWPLADAANAVNQPEQALIDEAQAWYYVEQEGPL